MRETDAGDVVRNFYAAVVRRDLGAARGYLADDVVFVGLFKTYRGADECMEALGRLLPLTVRLDVKTVIAAGHDAAIFFELETKAPAAGTILVGEWHQCRSGKITYVMAAQDGRPHAALFARKSGT